jgi:exonuclease SbcD
VIAGNHDHPRRLLAIQELLEFLDIHVRPEPARPESGGVVRVAKDGEVAQIAVLPFVTLGKIENAARLMGPEIERYQEYEERIARMIELLSQSFSPGTVNIVMAHLYINGAETSKSEREIHVAKPYAVSAQRLPAGAHYVALGHLHRPQEVPSASRALYAGSILQLDFGEREQQKRVVIVDAHPGRPATIESCALSSGRRLRDVSGTLNDLESRAGSFGDDLLRVTIKVEQPTPGIASAVRELLPNALEVKLDYPRTEAPAIQLSDLDPHELFRRFYSQQRESEPPEALSDLFRSLYEEAVNASD